MRELFRRLSLNIRGNVLAIAGAGAFAVVGGAGLGVDTAHWYLWKRQLQQAVDAGALAGAHALAQAAAYDPAARADLSENSNTDVVVEHLSSPPTSGDWAGNADAVEVIATTSRTLPFSSLFLLTAPTIRARAVAAIANEGEHCIIALAPTGVGVNVGGTANVQLGCGVAANSSGSHAIFLEGSSWLRATPLSSVGGIHNSGENYPSGTDVQPYGLPQTDPIADRNLEVPDEPSACIATGYEVPPNQTRTILPGRYCNGLSLKGNVVMAPGVYIIDGGSFYVGSHATVVGEGVTIILTGSSSSDVANIQIAGGSNVDIRAPTASEDSYWKGILLFQDPMASSPPLSEVAGGSSLELEGVVYMPSGNLRFAGGSGQHADCLMIVVNRVTMTGETSLGNTCPSDYDDLDFAGRRIRVVE